MVLKRAGSLWVAGCPRGRYGARPLMQAWDATRGQTADAQGQNIPPCTRCRPDTEVGVLY